MRTHTPAHTGAERTGGGSQAGAPPGRGAPPPAGPCGAHARDRVRAAAAAGARPAHAGEVGHTPRGRAEGSACACVCLRTHALRVRAYMPGTLLDSPTGHHRPTTRIGSWAPQCKLAAGPRNANWQLGPTMRIGSWAPHLLACPNRWLDT